MTKVLQTKGLSVTKTVAQLLVYDRIVTFDKPANLTDTVQLQLGSTGVIDFSKALEGLRTVEVTAHADGNTITGGDGNDTLYGSTVSDTLNGGSGNDTIYGSTELFSGYKDSFSGANFLNGGDGNDTIYSGAKKDVVDGGAGDDLLMLRDSTNKEITVEGGAGSDVLFAFGDITGLSVSGVETLVVGSNLVVATTAQLGSFDRIGYWAASFPENQGVNIKISGAGSLDLSDALNSDKEVFGGYRAVTLYTSEKGNTVTGGKRGDWLRGDSGDDVLNGGAGRDQIRDETNANDKDVFNGGSGNDEITSRGGDDIMDGGKGNDELKIVNPDGRFITAIGGEGWDALEIYGTGNITTVSFSEIEELFTAGRTVTATIAQLAQFERILDADPAADVEPTIHTVFISISGAGSINFAKALQDKRGVNVTLSDEGNSVTGGAKDDTFRGGAGVDRLYGGAGNDLLIGGASADKISGGSGRDTASYASAAAGLVANLTDASLNTGDAAGDIYSSIENLTGSRFDDTLTGNTKSNTLSGGGGSDVLTGDLGADLLDGGKGLDTMYGGKGNDTYVVNNKDDKVVENASEGTDLVQSSASFILSANVENLTLIGSSNLKGTGNALGNIIIGNTGNNFLDGGSGKDTLIGGKGNDTYVVDSNDDKLVENAKEGVDLIRSSLSYTLGNNFENLTLTGAADINGTGNSVANIVIGNSGNNTLDGGGGKDILKGGKGNDVYIIGKSADVVVESSNEGIDLVKSSTSHSLANNVENLTLTGRNHLDGNGNSLANTIVGNSGRNALNGGLGNDVLVGGEGIDTFIFDTKLGPRNIDRIEHFDAKSEEIRLGSNVFSQIGHGSLSQQEFHVGKQAHDADDRIIYDRSTGKLWYDADGTGKIDAVQFATLDRGLSLGEGSFYIV